MDAFERKTAEVVTAHPNEMMLTIKALKALDTSRDEARSVLLQSRELLDEPMLIVITAHLEWARNKGSEKAVETYETLKTLVENLIRGRRSGQNDHAPPPPPGLTPELAQIRIALLEAMAAEPERAHQILAEHVELIDERLIWVIDRFIALRRAKGHEGVAKAFEIVRGMVESVVRAKHGSAEGAHHEDVDGRQVRRWWQFWR